MKTSFKEVIRKILIENPDGLTAKSIAERIGLRGYTVRRCINLSMPDCYIDRWIRARRGQYEAVYCRADVPANAPHPEDRYPIIETTWRTRSAAAMEKVL